MASLHTKFRSLHPKIDEPIRAEIFGLARMEMHAESLANAQRAIAGGQSGNPLVIRIRENKKVLERSYVRIVRAVERKLAITPSAEWLIDNFYIVRAQLREIHDHMPPRYYRELPKLADGHLQGLPRVYGIAWAFVAHTDSRFDREFLTRFLKKYQEVQPLTIGELWALSTTLQIVLIENLRRLAESIAFSQEQRERADTLANEVLGLTEKPTGSGPTLEKVLAEEELPGAFVVQLLQRFRFQGMKFDPLLDLLEKRLVSEGKQADELVAAEHAAQTSANITVRNIVTSFRAMAAFDWQIFVEEISLAEKTLREHPIYGEMDFTTRNRYRHAVEELARYSDATEIEVAREVVSLCRQASESRARDKKSVDERALDPGYHLISAGRFFLEKKIGFRIPFSLRLRRWYLRRATPLYLGGIAFFTLLLWSPAALTHPGEGAHPWILALLALAGLIPASQLAVAIVNRVSISILGPRYLPRLRLEEGVPEELSTFVVVPTFLLEEDKIEEQCQQLEIYHLANPRGELYYALLSDWSDADQENIPGDETLLVTARRQIEALNRKHGTTAAGYERFYLFHRRRLFNPREGKWMGWERKRGKLEEFNRLLRGGREHSFLSLGDLPPVTPPNVRYVITLDSDTRLPSGSIQQLVGTIAHPLNRARFDEKTGRVTSGHGILQPRVTPTLPTMKEGTLFQRLSTGSSGLDPYAAAISDVYQDLFGEGSFSGKGIYEVDIFTRALRGRVPENSLLSHDLFEGNFARCGFISDVEVFEDFPWHTGVSAARMHRWIRGDWQLLPWILGRAGAAISAIGRWKMADNLRRSLLAPCCLVTICLSLLFPTEASIWWLFLALASLAADSLVTAVADFWPERKETWGRHITDFLFDLGEGLQRSLMALILLPYQSWMNGDAIVRSLYRLTISRRKLLEWTTAAQVSRSASLSLLYFIRSMWGSLVLVALGIVVFTLQPDASLVWAAPLAVIWMLAPLAAKLLSTPLRPETVRPLSPADTHLLQSTARRIWLFFATFVNEGDNHLPPDNFQEDPDPVVAHRSSPTNFGMYLLSTLSAKDFGWIGLTEAMERLKLTLVSMRDLPRHESGHFFNWYETSDRRALEPRYISSVDNGNLAGHLLSVAQGCVEHSEKFRPSFRVNAGLLTTYSLLQESTLFLLSKDEKPSATEWNFRQGVEELSDRLLAEDAEERGLAYWHELKSSTEAVLRQAEECIFTRPDKRLKEARAWAKAIHSDVTSHLLDLEPLVGFTVFARESWNGQTGPAWEKLRARIKDTVPLAEAEAFAAEVKSQIRELAPSAPAAAAFLSNLDESVSNFGRNARLLLENIREVEGLCRQLFRDMDFGMLYDSSRKLFSIGMRVSDGQLDPNYYDLLASEARLCSFVAIAKGDVPVSHWFQLGRPLTNVDSQTALLSWSGSMFEYLMPPLVMSSPEGSLLDQTTRLIVRRQIQYGQENGVPWGISESAFHQRDVHLTYQYTNFGVPDLGLKRVVGDELVIAPYATQMASMIDPAAAAQNLRALAKAGGSGLYGFYEAIDFSPSRLPQGKKCMPVRAFFAHHQGMSFVAIANILHQGRPQKRFHSDPMIQSAELLLQERTPRNATLNFGPEDKVQVAYVREETEHAARVYHNVDRPVPTTQLLSNGEYSVMLTSAGSGFSRCGDLSVTRFREDVTLDQWGTYFYLRDLGTDHIWSAGHQPTAATPDYYEASFSEDRVRISRVDDQISTSMEVFVSPEENAEVRRLTLVNQGSETREIEVTSYSEITMAPPLADAAHPAFSNLFVQTEFDPALKVILATRRARSAHETPVWMAHLLVTDRHASGEVSCETDRAKFIGRNRSVRDPAAMDKDAALSNSTGPVLDPVASLRTTVRLIPGVPCHLTFSTMMAKSRDEITGLADKFQDPANYERISSLAWTQAQVKLHYLGIEPDEAHLFQRLGTRMLFSDSSLRPSGEIIRRNDRDVTGLWSMGISGDNPIMLVRIDDLEDRGIVRQLLKAQEYFGTKRLTVDLVILNDKLNSYAQEVQHLLESMAQSGALAAHSTIAHSKGKAFVVRADIISPENRILLYASARAVLSSRQGSLAEQVRRARAIPPAAPAPRPALPSITASPVTIPDLSFFNGLGGFTPDGKEYVIVLNQGDHTPAPWINVIANPQFGFQVSESGSGYTWASNSRENQLTPWLNDPVGDTAGEAMYLYDEDSGLAWSPTAAPIRQINGSYVCRHGHGYSRFSHTSHGIRSELTLYADLEAPMKVIRLILENNSRSTRRIAVTNYAEWVLGFSRATMAPTTVTEFDEESAALFATNPRSNEYGTKVAFAACSAPIASYTGDRSEFLGRNGSYDKPVGLRKESLSNRAGAAMDPCAALRSVLEIPAGEKREIVFYLGQADSREQARELLQKARTSGAEEQFRVVTEYWENTLTAVQVRSPDPAMDLMLNRWLGYQTAVCRFWARAAFYQAGGAFGFRDQLQDVMALLYSRPDLAREHILRAASRQFAEGDVQHWWHPPLGRGVRTHFSDDLLWLPYTVFQYVNVTGDRSLLDAEASFLEGPALRPDQEDSYYTPETSHSSGSIYEHCVRALDRSLRTGKHGLPFIGAGDWNDGMNRVGHGGEGESVWLGWFLIVNLRQFSTIARARGDTRSAERWEKHAATLVRNIEEKSWDGQWYRRAYFDDGSPIGSASNEECRIDSLTQTWAVISGAGDPKRALTAMSSVEKMLVREQDKMILLFTPAFDKTPKDPGYIKGYLPGVRENGGQYTHAAIWCVIAETYLGRGKRAHELFSLLNPVRHAETKADMALYKVEPYVLAADVYSEAPHRGRGGWTWYTGSCGWMYRAGVENILGLRVRGNELSLQPVIPAEWPGFEIAYRYGRTVYRLTVKNPEQLEKGSVKFGSENIIRMVDDGQAHEIEGVIKLAP